MEASSSSSSSSSLSSSNRHKSFPASASGGSSRWKYDVFLSFRGEDTRNNFTDHLFAALDRKSIFTFKDDERLKRGTEISSELTKAIEDSRFSIVIFSKDYASSTWCLEELAKIVECMKTKDHTVIPVFYNVDPSHVRKQEGKFKKAFDKHQQNPKIDRYKIQRWRVALEQAANIAGYFISAGRPEAKLIEDIVNHIWRRLDFSSFDGDQWSRNLVGMDYHWEKMNELLEVESDDVRFIGVCGMGGIGKTTIARYVYDKISYIYEGSCFLENVRLVKRKNVVDLQKKLLSNIMKEENLNIPDDPEAAANLIRRWSCRNRIIVVLDDVDKLEQLEMLAGNHNWFGSGSRIIITTRDQHVLRSHGIISSSIYEVEGLKDDDALQLFHMKAFKIKQPKDGYIQLSRNIVRYVRGHPLALKVLGCHLCDRGVEEWNSALNRLRQVPSKEILETLRLSYDGLEELDKKIFLDIACFFKGKNKDWVMEILDSCDFDSTIGISVLIDRSLITISYVGNLDMHDLLQELGWAVVREQNPIDRGKWSRLWLWEDVYHVLTENRGTENVEGIMFNEHEQRIIHLDGKSFSRMINLKLLKISNVDLSEDLEYLSKELRYLKWHGYPSNSLPSNFHPRKLFVLDLCHSRIKYLWKGMEDFPKLKTIKLSYSHNLIETPDFTWVPNLEMLDLEGCTRLRKVHDSVGLLERLTILYLKGCKNLVSFPSNVPRSLKILNLQGCSKLDHLPQNLGELEVLEKLDAGETAIRQVPPSIARLSNLESLSLRGCKVQWWRSIFWPRKYLDSMCLSLPRFSGLFSLKRLELSDCRLSDRSLPSDLDSLCSLNELKLGNNNFVSLPDSIKRLSKLKILCVENCHRLQSLPELPPKIIYVGAEDCILLEDVSNALRGVTSPRFSLHLFNCLKLHENLGQENNLAIMLLKQYLQQPVNLSSQFHIRLPGFDIPEWFSCKNDGNSVEIGLPPNWLNDDFMGIAMCGVFEPAFENSDCIARMICTMSIMRNRYEFSFEIPSFIAVESHHLWLIYLSCVKFKYQTSYKRPDDEPYSSDAVLVGCSKAIHAAFQIDNDDGRDDKKCKVIKCGIRLVYKQDKNYFQESSAAEGSTGCPCHKYCCWSMHDDKAFSTIPLFFPLSWTWAGQRSEPCKNVDYCVCGLQDFPNLARRTLLTKRSIVAEA